MTIMKTFANWNEKTTLGHKIEHWEIKFKVDWNIDRTIVRYAVTDKFNMLRYYTFVLFL